MSNSENNLKDRFFRAVILGELGVVEQVSPEVCGVVVRLKAFKFYFKDIKTQYVNSFMPAATFEPGQFTPSHTKFLFRVSKGAYFIHTDVLVTYMRLMYGAGDLCGNNVFDIKSAGSGDGDSVNEMRLTYQGSGSV